MYGRVGTNSNFLFFDGALKYHKNLVFTRRLAINSIHLKLSSHFIIFKSIICSTKQKYLSLGNLIFNNNCLISWMFKDVEWKLSVIKKFYIISKTFFTFLCRFKKTQKFFRFQPKSNNECEWPKEFFSLWTSFCMDFKDIWKKEQQKRIREQLVLITISIIMHNFFSAIATHMLWERLKLSFSN